MNDEQASGKLETGGEVKDEHNAVTFPI